MSSDLADIHDDVVWVRNMSKDYLLQETCVCPFLSKHFKKLANISPPILFSSFWAVLC